MAFTINLIQKISEGGTSFGATPQAFTAETVTKMVETVADSVTDQEHLLAIDISQLQVFYMMSDQAITVETNSGSVPQETFTLAANVPVVFRTGDTAIFAGDITAFYLTNASGATATLNVMVGVNV